jgi:TPR repeat protein
MGLFIIHPNRNNGIHIRIKRDGKLMMSMDVLSKNPCTYDDNHLSCEMEATYFGKSIGVSPGFFVFQKVGDGLYDVTTLKPDGKTVDKVQTMYPCSMTILEAQAWVEANSGPGEIGEKLGETINTLEQLTPQIEGGKKKKIELLKKQVKSGDGWAQAGLGTLHLMAAIKNIGVEHDPERGLALLKEAAEKKLVSAYVMLGNANMIPGLAFPKQNYVTAFGWYEKAAQTGRADALNMAGMMKLFGLGTKQDGPQSIEWLTRASEQGNPSAHFNLGIIRVFFPKELKQRWKVSLEQDPVTGMMHINLAAEQGHEPSKMMLQFLNQKRHPKLAYPAQAKANLWKKKHPRKLARNRDYPDSTIEMEFKIEGGQIKFMDANINANLVWALGAGGAVVNRDKVQKTPEITRSSYSGTFGLERKDYKIETNFEISNDKLFGDYNYELAGVIYTGKLYDAKRVSNRLELVWEEKSGGKVYKGKLVIDIGIDWSEFNGIYYYNNGKIGGTWTGKLKNNKKSVIEYYLNLLSGMIFLPKNGNKQFLLNKWWGDDDCVYLSLWDDEGNEYDIYNKELLENPIQRYINDKWWIATYGKMYIADYYIKGEFSIK